MKLFLVGALVVAVMVLFCAVLIFLSMMTGCCHYPKCLECPKCPGCDCFIQVPSTYPTQAEAEAKAKAEAEAQK